MKKALCLVALLGAMVASADDSYLYWMVGSDAGNDYSYARIKDDSGNYLSIYDSGFDSEYADNGDKSISKENINDLRSYNEGLYAALGSGSTASSFIVELYNDNDKFVSQSVIPYSPGSIWSGGIGAPAATLATFQSFAVPEPNSALLMLVGCAMLGLRRRKQKKA